MDSTIEKAIVAINDVIHEHSDHMFPSDYQALRDAREGLERLQNEGYT